jgi:type IV pilus assembly protein PilB
LTRKASSWACPELGFFADDQAKFQGLISGSDGVFLVTGPTGSGKSTTLYSALNYINKPDRKIITVEDPSNTRWPASIRCRSSATSA